MSWDDCSPTEWDIARNASEHMMGKFRYMGCKKWEYWDQSQNEWCEDKRRSQVRRYLQVNISERIRERAYEWQTQISHHIDAPLMSTRLLHLSQKMHSPQFLNRVLRELQEFLETD
jgi:hypothetical protein